MEFKEWVNGKNPVVYQVTYLTNLKDIFNSKLKASGGKSVWLKDDIKSHSKKGVFFCSDLHCVKHWVVQLGEQAFSINKDPMKNRLIPIILKFRLNKNSWLPDYRGNLDYNKSFNDIKNFYSDKEIDPKGILFWNGYKWTNNLNEAEEILSLLYDYGNRELEEDYPFPF